MKNNTLSPSFPLDCRCRRSSLLNHCIRAPLAPIEATLSSFEATAFLHRRIWLASCAILSSKLAPILRVARLPFRPSALFNSQLSHWPSQIVSLL